jgi:hypothetical protein
MPKYRLSLGIVKRGLQTGKDFLKKMETQGGFIVFCQHKLVWICFISPTFSVCPDLKALILPRMGLPSR